MQFDYPNYDAVGLAELLRTNQITASEVLEAAIHQIELQNPRLNAVTLKMYDQARAQLDNLERRLPLAGIPMLLKDLLADYAGEPTSYGSAWLRNLPVETDGELVKRYKRAGLVIVGKTNVPEFGLGAVTEPLIYGPAHNPWNLDLTPGGSSGGSAAAVASGMVPIAHGNDGGGSIRIPASCCGLFGLKPGRGLMPAGTQTFQKRWQGLIADHVLTRSVRDSAWLLDATALQLPVRSFSDYIQMPSAALRIGVLTQPILGYTQPHTDCVNAVKNTAALCQTLGHTVEEVKLPFDAEKLRWIYTVIVTAEVNNMLQQFAELIGKKAGHHDIELITAIFAQIGEHFTAADFARAVMEMDIIALQFDEFMQSYDVLLTPVLAKPPVEIGTFKPTTLETIMLQAVQRLHSGVLLDKIQAIMSKDIFNYVAYTPLCNLTGHPAMSVPLHWNAENIPIGSHFIGRMNSEALLLQLAAQLEEAQPWKQRYTFSS